jgi:predicted transcriptional regulator
MDTNDTRQLSELTADIVAAYVSTNNVRPEDLGTLISDVHAALKRTPSTAEQPAPEAQEPAVSIRKSVTPDYIYCLEDGKKFKSMKRHLQGEHGMTPDEYRAKWGLKRDYPMVAPNYSEARSGLAKSLGLGRKAGGDAGAAADVADEVPAEPAPAPAKRGRRPKAAA